jgi:hypothetical protein
MSIADALSRATRQGIAHTPFSRRICIYQRCLIPTVPA